MGVGTALLHYQLFDTEYVESEYENIPCFDAPQEWPQVDPEPNITYQTALYVECE